MFKKIKNKIARIFSSVVVASICLLGPIFGATPIHALSYDCTSANYGCVTGGWTGQNSANFYYGHNCTTYADYRIRQNGAPYGAASGNASEWAVNARAKGYAVDQTPAPGSVAQWNAYTVGGPSYAGHVAYVESVSNNGNTIIITDSSTTPYTVNRQTVYESRKTVNRTDSYWPSNFIHFKDLSNPNTGAFFKFGFTNLGTNILNAGQEIRLGQMLVSDDNRFVLVLQQEGNLVAYKQGGVAIWSTPTVNKGVTRGIMQSDGNFVLVNAANQAIWSTGVAGKSNSRLIIQVDGNVVTYTGSTATWSSGSTQAGPVAQFLNTNTLTSGAILQNNQYIRSNNRKYVFYMSNDGELFIYGAGWQQIWSSGAKGGTGNRLVMQAPGNLVQYNAPGTAAVWFNSASGVAGSRVSMQDEGNLVIYSPSNIAQWWTSTGVN